MIDLTYQENERRIKACNEAELLLRDLLGNAAKELKDAEPILQAHDALEEIWDIALVGTNAPQVAWDECRNSVNHTFELFDTMVQQLDAGKFDLPSLKTPENRHNLLLTLKTIEVRQLQLKPFEGNKQYSLDQEALSQLLNMLTAALNLIQTTYDLLKA